MTPLQIALIGAATLLATELARLGTVLIAVTYVRHYIEAGAERNIHVNVGPLRATITAYGPGAPRPHPGAPSSTNWSWRLPGTDRPSRGKSHATNAASRIRQELAEDAARDLHP
jgi:hypothetical protein